jgi:hypothetical protein
VFHDIWVFYWVKEGGGKAKEIQHKVSQGRVRGREVQISAGAASSVSKLPLRLRSTAQAGTDPNAARGGHQAGNERKGRTNAARAGHQAGNHGGQVPNRQQHAGAGGRHDGHPGSERGYHLTHGRQFSHGYFYPGRDHRHWAYTRFDDRYGCTLYYDPDLGCYYYWCEPDDCYYPVSYRPYDRYAWSSAGDPPNDQDVR